eukprot:scaffold572026_cov52-Prasinocladus_malaysianus.AAC.1
MSSYASQRLISLYDLLWRQLVKLEHRREPQMDQDTAGEVALTSDFLQTVLEIINLLLVHSLPRNPEFAYTLLHRQELFADLCGHSRFSVLACNISTVVQFFNDKVEQA